MKRHPGTGTGTGTGPGTGTASEGKPIVPPIASGNGGAMGGANKVLKFVMLKIAHTFYTLQLFKTGSHEITI